jgi:hypothetical protein
MSNLDVDQGWLAAATQSPAWIRLSMPKPITVTEVQALFFYKNQAALHSDTPLPCQVAQGLINGLCPSDIKI